MGMVRATIERAASQGLFDQALDKNYEVPFFQFFIGDLGNFIDYANKLPAHDPITISCAFSKDRASELETSRFDEHDIYIQVPEDCTISYKSSVVMKISFDMNIVVRLVNFFHYLGRLRRSSERSYYQSWCLWRQILYD